MNAMTENVRIINLDTLQNVVFEALLAGAVDRGQLVDAVEAYRAETQLAADEVSLEDCIAHALREIADDHGLLTEIGDGIAEPLALALGLPEPVEV
jgi:hypothetical protein